MKLSLSQALKSTILGTILDIVLGIAKITVGLQHSSHALVLDGIHSFTDVLTDAFVIIVSKFSSESPDESHPYGHEKIETIGTLALGSILMATSGALLFEIVQRLLSGQNSTNPGSPAMLVAGISVIVKELLYQYRIRVGKKLKSPILIANAWHSRSDALSSVAVLIGIVFSKFGFPIFDTLAGLVVVIMIGSVAWRFIKDSFLELVETSLSSELRNQMKTVILASEGVIDFHSLRSRKVGNNAFIDVNVEVSPDVTVSEGHEIGAWVVKNLQLKFDMIADVTVHIDTENDLVTPFSSDTHALLPLRSRIIKDIKGHYQNQHFFDSIQRWNLNYKLGKVVVDLYFNQNSIQNMSISAKELSAQCRGIKYLDRIEYYYK